MGSRWLEWAAYGVSVATLAGFPISVGMAIARYRLYDIDVIINRALVYGSLSVMLVVMYLVIVVGMQRLLSPLTGDSNQLATVASTLVIAALFSPLRARTQSFMDRRFYRSKYDARKTLEAFSMKLREETDLDRLGDELLFAVRETMQPEHASLWLREPKRAVNETS